jgi:hypothetical protein
MPRQKTREKLLDRIGEPNPKTSTGSSRFNRRNHRARGGRRRRGGRMTPACGAGWRKEAHQVTDRRLRQRAVECRCQIMSTAVSTGI